jgi:hypothetical protein
VVTVPEALRTFVQASCAEKAKVSLLGRIYGKHPGLKALTAWARATLHSSLKLLSLKANNLFELSFSEPEGRIHALTQTELVCDNATISFASWRPHFDANIQQETNQLDFPIWVQIVDLCQPLRDDAYLRNIGAHIGQVIAIDNSEAYKAKLFGPRIRILVRDINNLPKTAVLPRVDEEGDVEYHLEYSGLPNQCGRCRARDHQFRQCPRRDLKPKEHQVRNKHVNVAPATGTQQPINQHPASPPRTEQTTPNDSRRGPLPQRLNFITETPKATPIAEANTIEVPPSPPTQPIEPKIPPELQPNDLNFPQLSSPSPGNTSTPPPTQTTQPPGTPHTFIWRKKPPVEEQEKGKGKLKTHSAPITRQGYRTGRLAEDLWEVLNIPGTPASARKTVRVLPLLTKNYTHTEYLVDNSKSSFAPISTVQIAEVLAGIPWTLTRARLHIVNEVSHALHKVLIFNNQNNTPIHKWEQGIWHSQWTTTEEGEHTCTLYAHIAIPESKLKIRKGKEFGWRPIPAAIQETLTGQPTALIQDIEGNGDQWQEMVGLKEKSHTPHPTPTTATRDSSKQLTDEEVRTS